MNRSVNGSWVEANQRYLMAAIRAVREALDRHVTLSDGGAGDVARAAGDRGAARAEMEEAGRSMSSPPTVERLSEAFGLSSFERDVVLLCAGMELDSEFPRQCAVAQGDPQRAYPTFSLALTALKEAHWSALSPSAPLRRWRLIEIIGTGHSQPVTGCALRIDERVLHFLTGVATLDERLIGTIEWLHTSDGLVPSHQVLVERIRTVWARSREGACLPVVQLCGEDTSGKRAIAAAALSAVGLGVALLQASSLPISPAELETFMRLWEREAAFTGSALLLEVGEADAADPVRERAIDHFLELTDAALMIASHERWRPAHRPMVTCDVAKPTPTEQHAAWRKALGPAVFDLNGRVEALVSQFSLSLPAIRAATEQVIWALKDGNLGTPELDSQTDSAFKSPHAQGSEDLAKLLWDACRVQTRPRLADLAQRIEPAATWGDLVLPESQRCIVKDIVVHVRQRIMVYERWGFSTKGRRGLGISALFVGSSGTGKTMAAEVLANDLRLDLYRIDLSSVVSKYIGETEKNLRRVFDAAEEGGAILLFDEADALFGKRSEVKDSHDRYANIEISYLLQRMEAYRGLAILTTNMKSALDQAFLRRIRFVVQFPFPDPAQRTEIWRCIFPSQTPVEGFDVEKLARLNVTGGSIRNIALNAAFLAADAGEPVRMKHLLSAARSEYAKLEKPLAEAEIRGWA